MGVRINKYIASSGYCSRRQADELVESGKVTIDGVKAVNGSVVEDGNVVMVDGHEIIPEDNKIYIALHKPLGITCTTDRRDPTNIIDYLGMDERVFPIGRLDKNSSRYVRLFYDRNYESLLEGEITEMGAGLVLRKRAERLKDLFIFRTKKKEEKK